MILPLYHDLVLALTPIERYQSAGQFRSSNSLELWYLGVAAVAVIGLTLAFLVSRYYQNRVTADKKRKREFFIYYARKSGFTDRQCDILYSMTKWPAVKNLEDIFIMPNAFENMAAYIWEKCLKRHGLEAAKSLQNEIQDIKKKLGFDTTGTSHGTRRGYMRVRMHRQALISAFPFSLEINEDAIEGEGERLLLQEIDAVKFKCGILSELAVTAVAIRAKESIDKGSRVLVIFERDDPNDESISETMSSLRDVRRKLISHFGVVKRVDTCGEEFKIVVEFINLTADQINEMLRITSEASRNRIQDNDIDGSGQGAPELVSSGVN